MLKIVRRAVSIIFILMSTAILIWAIISSRRQEVSAYLDPTMMKLSSPGETAVPALLEVRQVRIEWPSSLRIGDQYIVTLLFAPAKSEILLPVPEGNFTDVYANYNLMAEGRFELAGAVLVPAFPQRESLPSGQTVKLKWKISTWQAGTYPGKIWLLLRFLPLDGGKPSEVPIFIHELDLNATSLFGLSGPMARLVGGLGIILGLALSGDVMIGWIKRR